MPAKRFDKMNSGQMHMMHQYNNYPQHQQQHQPHQHQHQHQHPHQHQQQHQHQHQHQQHQHQQHQQMHQQHQQHDPQFYMGGSMQQHSPISPNGRGMMHYNSRIPPPSIPSNYMYNPPKNMPPHMYKYSVPPSSAPPPHLMIPPTNNLPPLPSTSGTSTAPKSTKAEEQPKPADGEELPTVINMKPKRKSKSSRITCPKGWVREDAIKVIALEEEYSKRSAKAPILLLRFPDPDLNRDIINNYSPSIDSVHFQQNSGPRYCFVHLKPDADIEKTIETISKIPFGTGFVSAELKRVPTAASVPTVPEDVDPYTLYIGNLPTTITIHTVKEHFPGAHRIDIGHAQRMKYTRYAFIRYDSVDKAMAAYKRSVNTLIESRSLIVRFFRQRSTVAAGEPVSRKNAKNEIDDAINNLDIEENTQTSKASSTSKTNRLGSAFDSPSSIEEPENIEIDSKENVKKEVEKFKQQLQHDLEQELNAVVGSSVESPLQKRNSLEEMFAELDKEEKNLPRSDNNAVLTVGDVQIKQEILDDSEEDIPSNNVVSLRSHEEVSNIKVEPDDGVPSNSNSSTMHNRNEVYPGEFDYIEDLPMDLEETDDDNWLRTSAAKRRRESMLYGENNPLESMRQRELSMVENKPDIATLNARANRPSGSANTTREHSTFVKELYDQVRRAKDVRRRDDLDDLFAQMNSDDENDEDDNFL